VALTTKEKPVLGSLVDTLREDKKMTALQIKTTLFLMYFAGSETTASLLGELLYQLGRLPDYQETIFQEIKEGSSPSLENLFTESIRFFTPAYIIGRQPADNLICIIKDKQGKPLYQEHIAKNDVLLCTPTFAARDPNLFENPDQFIPERLQKGSSALSWLPFADGKHTCPGQWLAKAEVLALTTALIKNFRIKSCPKESMKQKGYMTLKTEGEVWIELERR
jgi:cytochrome P450